MEVIAIKNETHNSFLIQFIEFEENREDKKFFFEKTFRKKNKEKK